MKALRERLWPVVLFGVVGGGVLCALGFWQLHRLEQKTAYIAQMRGKIDAPAVDLPMTPSPERERFLSVGFSGILLDDEIHVLTSQIGRGPGYRVIGVVKTEGRRIMVDRGFIAQTQKSVAREKGFVEIVGNIHWPKEVDMFTPAPDRQKNIWFARDVRALSEALESEPFLVIVRKSSLTPPDALPLTISGIPNRHLEYVITWFLLAAVWGAMSCYLLWSKMGRKGVRGE